jgi:predicted permease
MIRESLTRLRHLLGLSPHRSHRADLDDELRFHLDQSVEQNIASGMSPEIAHRQALIQLGGVQRTREQCHRVRPGWWIGILANDLRYAARQLRKSPGYTVTAVLTLTLAIGANTAIFAMMYALLLRSLPVEHPEQMVQIKLQLTSPTTGPAAPGDYMPGKIFDAVAAQQHVFSGMCAWSQAALNLRDIGGTRPVNAAMLTGGCFEMLGLHAALGRLFTPADDQPGGEAEGYPVVLSYEYWRNHLGADPAVVGKVLDFEDNKGVVVGVLQTGFESVTVGDRPWMYVASEMGGKEERHGMGGFDHVVLARLKEGVTVSRAQAQIDSRFTAWIAAEKPTFFTFNVGKFETASQAHMVTVPGRTGFSYMREEYSRPLYLIEGMVSLSLLVACAYLATLASTRALARRRELALRIALGASRMRVAVQLCAESVLVALIGSGLGILFAWIAARALVLLLDPGHGGQPLELEATPGGAALLFTLGLSVLTVLLAGVGPAWRATRLDPATDIKEGEPSQTGRGHRRLGRWLVPVQIAFSLVIVAIAALMASTMNRLRAVDPGFRSSGLFFINADFSHHLGPAATAGSPKIPTALYASLLERIRRAPGVDAASISQSYQMSGAIYVNSAASTLPSGEMRKDNSLIDLSVTPDYFKTLRIPVLGGRDFSSGDKQGAPRVCILSQSAAQYFFPGGNAVGSMLTMQADHKDTPRQVVGVVGDTLYNGLRDAAPRLVYLPYLAGSGWSPNGYLAVRASDTAAGIAAVRSAFRELAPDVPLDEPVMMSALVAGSVGRERLVAVLASFFAFLTLTLTAIGLYGLLSYGVIRRRTEIGIRMALGASRAGVVRLILADSSRLVLPGIFLGAAGIWAATRLLDTLLYGVKPLDPWICMASVALLLFCASAACILPARRAASVHPLESLRFQ